MSDEAASAPVERAALRRKRLGLAAIVSLVTLILVELGLRVVLGNLDIAPFVLDPGDGRCVGLEPGGESSYTGTVLRIPTVVHGANEFGYRGPAIGPERSADTGLRIVALGDSFTYGQGVRAEEALPARLEVELAATRETPIEVLNFGVPGYNLHEAVEQYNYLAGDWHPDAVVLFLFENDLDAPACDIVGRRLFMAAFRRIRLFRVTIVSLAPELLGTPDPHYSPERSAQLETELTELEAAVEATGARLFVVSIADPLDDAEATRAVTAKLEQPAYVFDRDAFESFETIPNETHWTVEANAEAAAEIAAWLAPQL